MTSNHVAVSSRLNARIIEKAVELKESGKANISWPRLADTYKGRVSELHALFSPVTELPNGWTVLNMNHLKKLETALGPEAKGVLVAIVEGGSTRDPEDFE